MSTDWPNPEKVFFIPSVGSCPLGIDESETFQKPPCSLNETTPFYFYTDGITEARGPAEVLIRR